MTASVVADVEVLDLRAPQDGSPGRPVGRVIVLDHADALVDHWDTYLALAGDRQVAGVVCVAVGEPSTSRDNGTRNPVVLRVPAVLSQSGGAVLWVGDEQGVLWGQGRNQPAPVRTGPGEPTGLQRLVAALHVEEVFDAVRDQAADLPGQVACPASVLFSGAVVAGSLVAARDGALQELVRVRYDAAPVEVLRQTIDELARGPQERPAGDLQGRIGTVRGQAFANRERAERLSRDVGSLRLFTGDPEHRGDRAGPALADVVTRAGAAAADYRETAAILLDRIDGHLRRGDTTLAKVAEMGLREPVGVAPDDVVRALEPAVAAHLVTEPSLPTLSVHLRRAASELEPAGCPGAADAVRATGGDLARSLPKGTHWPVSPVLLPLTLVACAVAAFVPPPPLLSWLVGIAALLLWFVPAWMLLARWPQETGEMGPEDAALRAVATFGLFGLVGVLLGALGARYAARATQWDVLGLLTVPVRTRVTIVVVTFLLSALAVWASWKVSAHLLRKGLRLGQLAATHRTVSDVLIGPNGVVGREWVPAARRRVLADALNETADGIDEIDERLRNPDERERELFARAPSRYTPAALPGGVPNALADDVRRVVRDDLVRRVCAALSLAGDATRRRRRTTPGVYRQRLNGLLEEYDDQVHAHGLMTLPRTAYPELDLDPTTRDTLLRTVWAEAPQARIALGTRPYDDMNQLCSADQLGDLSTYGEPVMIRFAPAQARDVLTAVSARGPAPSAAVVWTDRAELAGVVRLLEMQPGAREVVPTGGAS